MGALSILEQSCQLAIARCAGEANGLIQVDSTPLGWPHLKYNYEKLLLLDLRLTFECRAKAENLKRFGTCVQQSRDVSVIVVPPGHGDRQP